MAILLALSLAFLAARGLLRLAQGPHSLNLPTHGQYEVPSEGFLHGSIGSMKNVHASLLDSSGVLLFDYGGDLGRQYNPLFIADFAMALVPLKDEAEAWRILVANLEYLLASAVKTPGGRLLFPYQFDFPVAGEKAPWFSAMAQARVGQALMWGWRLTGEPRYLKAAKDAIFALHEGPQDPPLAKRLEGGLWLNEFPASRFSVLDGSLVAVVGVHEVFKGLPADDPDRARMRLLFEDALTGFKRNQGCFTTPFGGVYFSDERIRPTQSYYDIVMTQLKYLERIDGEVAAIASRYAVAGMSTPRRLGLVWWMRLDRWRRKQGLIDPCVR